MLTIVGGIPEPIGGVSIFTHRLTTALSESRPCRLLDMYPCANKSRAAENVDHRIAPKFRPGRFWWLIRNTFRQPVVHFNFSLPRASLVFMLLPKWKSQWILTLHHGDLWNYHSPGLGFLWRLIGRRIDHIVALTEQQRSYFLDNGISTDRISVGGSYIRPVPDESEQAETQTIIRELKRSHRKIVFASGYKTKIYRHLELIREFRNANGSDDCCLLLCIYGPDPESLESKIRKQVDEFDNVKLMGSVSQAAYNYILRNVDVYVRPNAIDSCGIAVHDAYHFGTQIVASDVCERPKSAAVFPMDDWNRFRELLERQLDDSAGSRDSSTVPETESDFLAFYHRLYSGAESEGRA